MDKKLIRNAIIAVVVICVLIALYFFAVKLELENTDAQTDVNAQIQSEDLTVMAVEMNDIKSIEYENEKGNFVIIKGDNSYYVEGQDSANFAQARLTSPFIKVENIKAERCIGEGLNLEEYGLSEPIATITVTLINNEIKKLIIGNIDPTGQGYYVKTDESDKVYLVSEYAVLDFFAGIGDFKNKLITSFSFSTLENLEIYKGNEPITTIRKRNETDTLTDIVVEQYIMTYPFYEYVSMQELSVLFENIVTLSAIEVADDTTANADAYGIGAYTFKFTDNYGSHVLKLGNKLADGNVYAVYEGINCVYVIDGEWLKIAEEIVPFDYIYKLTNIYMIDDLSELTFVSPFGNHYLKVSKSGNKTVYMVNDKEVSEQVFKDVYTEFMSMMFAGDGRNVTPGDEIGSLTFKFNDGASEVIKYYNVDERNYLVTKSNGAKYLVLKKNFDTVFEKVESLLK